MNNTVFWKTMENVRRHRDIKFVKKIRRNNLVSEPNYHATTLFTENLLAIKIKKKNPEKRMINPDKRLSIYNFQL